MFFLLLLLLSLWPHPADPDAALILAKADAIRAEQANARAEQALIGVWRPNADAQEVIAAAPDDVGPPVLFRTGPTPARPAPEPWEESGALLLVMLAMLAAGLRLGWEWGWEARDKRQAERDGENATAMRRDLDVSLFAAPDGKEIKEIRR